MLPNPGLPDPRSLPPASANRPVSLSVARPVRVALMLAANLAFHRGSPWSVLIGLTVTGALVGLSRWGRLSAADLGLTRSTWSAGLRWGGVRRRDRHRDTRWRC